MPGRRRGPVHPLRPSGQEGRPGLLRLGREGVIQEAIRAIKKAYPDFYVITDVCMCEYTDHGHCGILCGEQVDNDKTLDVLARTALSHAQAGADMVAPSDMMDGRVAAIRAALDGHGFPERAHHVLLSAKYASAFYGPFRRPPAPPPPLGTGRAIRWTPTTAGRP